MLIDTSGGHSAMDYGEHARTYAGFVRGIIIVVLVIAAILLGMLYFLV
jgi:hypothetical protein